MTSSFTKYIQYTAALFVIGLCSFFFLVPDALAQEEPFVPLVGIPGITNLSTGGSLVEYVNALYILIIGIGCLIGVIKIGMAGVKYSLDEIVTHKQDAKNDIKGVLLGLAILLIPFIVLNTINPNLTNLDVLKLAPTVDLKETQNSNGSSPVSSPITPGRVTRWCAYTLVRTGGTMGNPIMDYDKSQCINQCKVWPDSTFYPEQALQGTQWVSKTGGGTCAYDKR